ncbi:MAG: hypothetical protein ACRDOV_08230, partial [Streptomyces sp.]
MAYDDRYRWLDDEAAERLLRGSPVDGRSRPRRGRNGDDPGGADAAVPGTSWGAATAGPSTGAERLAALLDALVAEQTATPSALGAGRPERPAQQSAELPGEE